MIAERRSPWPQGKERLGQRRNTAWGAHAAISSAALPLAATPLAADAAVSAAHGQYGPRDTWLPRHHLLLGWLSALVDGASAPRTNAASNAADMMSVMVTSERQPSTNAPVEVAPAFVCTRTLMRCSLGWGIE